jgi:hypothetical protein
MDDNENIVDEDFQDPEEENPPADEEEVKNDSDDDFGDDFSDGGWISWFCQLEGNDFLVEVDEEFIKSEMNLLGFHLMFKNYK